MLPACQRRVASLSIIHEVKPISQKKQEVNEGDHVEFT